MAIVTGVAAGNMCRVLAGRYRTVVTRSAGAEDLGMVDGVGRRKHVGIVTVLANVGRLYVCRTFADGIESIVAARTVVEYASVIEVRRAPRDSCVAVVTGISTRNMRRVFAGCRRTIVTGDTRANHLGVIDSEDWRENIRIVAVLAGVTCRYVRCVLARRINAIMAVEAVAHDIHVIEIGGQPGSRRVTVIASVVARDMRRVLASRSDAVVAITATSHDLRMVDCYHR
jgi:hypothetical protein